MKKEGFVRIKGWDCEAQVGAGAFAKVYRVKEAHDGRVLACKVTHGAEGMRILQKEAELQKTLRHPLFAEYADYMQEADRALLFMEYVEGESLQDILTRQGAFSQGKAVQIAAELAEGLYYLHSLPGCVLYRDLKPDNIRIRRDGRVKLLDLGCACKMEEAVRSRAGSRGYAAPEQLGERTAEGAVTGPCSDVYALGRLLHYMLSGQDPCQPPFRKHPVRAYDPMISPLLERLVEQCIAVSPAERLPDVYSVLRQLAPFLRQRKSVFLRMREQRALIEWRMSGRSWEGDFCYEKCICKIPENVK